MATTREELPGDIDALRAALIAERAKRIDEAVRAARVVTFKVSRATERRASRWAGMEERASSLLLRSQ